MANTYFQFKQFKVEQSGSAMKVCTESCIFGALIQKTTPRRILDIGTGTGLLSLMLAQKYDCAIDSVEINKAAASQAKDNFTNSPWANRLKVHSKSFQEFCQETNRQYDLIVTNPPFFTNQLKSPDESKNVAHHTIALPHQDLIDGICDLLISDGSCFVLLPPTETAHFERLALKNDLFPVRRTVLFDHLGAPALREITEYRFEPAKFDATELYIKERKGGEYTSEFTQLLKPYYLYL